MKDPLYQYLKLAADWLPSWLILLVLLGAWLARRPQILLKLREHISGAKLGQFEIQLREVEQKLQETEAQVKGLTASNTRLRQVLDTMNINAPAAELKRARQVIKAIAGGLQDLEPVRAGLKPEAPPVAVYVSAEVLRSLRIVEMFDELVGAVGRIASSADLEGLRLKTIWTLASAVHRTLVGAVKHDGAPQLTVQQLRSAEQVMETLIAHPKVQQDRPDDPGKGIRGPSRHALNWIRKGLEAHEGNGVSPASDR